VDAAYERPILMRVQDAKEAAKKAKLAKLAAKAEKARAPAAGSTKAADKKAKAKAESDAKKVGCRTCDARHHTTVTVNNGRLLRAAAAA
jgi:hypothetical protein